jgi:hypothetical protein
VLVLSALTDPATSSRLAQGQSTGQMVREMEITTSTLRTYPARPFGPAG